MKTSLAHSTRWLGAALLLATVLTQAGCGSTSSSGDPDPTVGSFRFTFPQARAVAGGQGSGGAGLVVAAADLTNDNRADFVVANTNLGSLSVFRSIGTDFSPETGVSVPATPVGLTFDDFDHDGNKDCVVITPTQVAVLFGDGSGNFTPFQAVAVGSDNRSVTVGDFDQDGNTDIAVGSGSGPALHVIYTNGNRDVSGYVVSDFSFNSTVVNVPVQLATADFDLNGSTDLVVGNGNGNFCTVLYNAGGARGDRFGAGASNNNLTVSSDFRVNGVGAGDFDGDGRPDVCCSASDPNIGSDSTDGVGQLFLNTSTGFVLGGQQNTSPALGPVATGQLSPFDTQLDFLFTSRVGLNNNGTGEVDVLLGLGNGQLSPQARFIGSDGNPITAAAVGDFTGDGAVDIVAVAPGVCYTYYNLTAVDASN